MYLIRRSAFRALTSPSTSLLAKSRSITTTSPFITRSKLQSSIYPICRRFSSDDVGFEQDSTSSVSSGGGSSISSSVSSSAEYEPTYLSDAAERLHSASDKSPVDRDIPTRYPQPVSQRPLILTPSSTVYLGNLTFDVTEDGLKEEFSECGMIEDVRIAKDVRGFSKGFAHMRFETIEEAATAIKMKDQIVLGGRRLVVNFSASAASKKGPQNPTATLYIGNLAFEMSDADLNTLFRPVKNVIDVRVAIDRRTGQPRGFAHADFVDVKSAAAAVEYLKEQSLFGRKLRVDFADARDGWSGRGQGLRNNDRYDQRS